MKTIYHLVNRIIPILLLSFSCSDSTSVDNSVRTFEVKTILNLPIEEFTAKFGASFFPTSILLEDYDAESDFIGRINSSKYGWLNITRNCNGRFDCFSVELDSSYYPVEFILFTDLIISNSEMTGQFAEAGSTIDTAGLEFTASRKD